MKFLIDENIPAGIANELLKRGIDIISIPRGSSDRQIADFA